MEAQQPDVKISEGPRNVEDVVEDTIQFVFGGLGYKSNTGGLRNNE